MRETTDDLDQLQALLDRSHTAAGAHLQSIFNAVPGLSAVDLAHTLEGIFEMHLATLAGNGAPLVAPIDGIFFKGKVCFALPGQSVRAPLVRRDRRVSASFTQDSFAFIVHGTAREVDHVEDLDALVKELYVAQYGPGWVDWHDEYRREHGPGFKGWIEPRVMFAKR